MEKQTQTKINNNGTYTKVETMQTTPEDNFVPFDTRRPNALYDYNKDKMYHKGISKTVSFTTDDPRITRPFVWIISLIFIVIGIYQIFNDLVFFGILFLPIGIAFFIKGNKDINKIAKEYKKQNIDTSINSLEEVKELTKQVSSNVTNAVVDVKRSIFTKKTMNKFLIISSIFFIIAIIFIIIFFYQIGEIVLAIPASAVVIITYIIWFVIAKLLSK